MKYKQISLILWISSIIFTLLFVMYQRATGPTYPIRGNVTLNEKNYTYRLIRTFGGETDAHVQLKIADERISGSMMYQRYKSHDKWTIADMQREGDMLVGMIPEQPPAGKVKYTITLYDDHGAHSLTDDPVIIRFKGHVPSWIVIIHVFLIFMAMLLSTRAGLEAYINGPKVFTFSLLTFLLLTIGGLIFGGIMQKYAFGQYWTGWPVGHDLTDNKTLVAFIFWTIAFLTLLRERQQYLWVKIAAIVLIGIFLIPHSMLGSEIDYREMDEYPPVEYTIFEPADSLSQTEINENTDTLIINTND